MKNLNSFANVESANKKSSETYTELQSNSFLGNRSTMTDELLPRVAPHVTRYGFFRYEEIAGYHANQSITYNPTNKRLLFGISNSYEEKAYAYIYETDMNLNEIRHVQIENGYHINDMMFSNDYGRLMIAPLNSSKAIIRVYSYPSLSLMNDIDLSAYFNQNTTIDALCNVHEENMYIIKGGSRIVFFDYNFNKLKSLEIDVSDLHGDPLLYQTLEYYKGYILQLNAGDYVQMGTTKHAYLNIYRPDGSKVDTYRYPDSDDNMEAEGICSIGNGKYLFTHYGGTRIEVRLLDFNNPSHTHTCADIIDLDKLGVNLNALSSKTGTNLGKCSGCTLSRPANPFVGQFYFDNDINKPIWWNGSSWVDAIGNVCQLGIRKE